MESLEIRSDRHVLTQTLKEVAHLLQTSSTMTWKLSSYRALGRVLFLLRHLCRDHLSARDLESIRVTSRELAQLLVQVKDRAHSLNPEQDRLFDQLPNLDLE